MIKIKKDLDTKRTKLDFNKIVSNKKHLRKYKKKWIKLSPEEKKRWGTVGGRRFHSWWFNLVGCDWQCRHWGTKWNTSCDCCDLNDNELIYSFDTAWGPPMPIINALLDRYKTIDVELTYSVEGGNGAGHIKTENRETVLDDHYDVWMFECPNCETYFEEREDKTGFTKCPDCGTEIDIEKYKLAERI